MVASILTAICFSTTARADMYLPVGDDRYLALPSGLILTILIGGSIFAALCMIGVVSGSPPAPPPSPEEYDQRAAEYRAKSRMLEAEAAYDDSRAKAALKKQELKDVAEFLRGLHSKSTRR
jgi:hypothetical protein